MEYKLNIITSNYDVKQFTSLVALGRLLESLRLSVRNEMSKTIQDPRRCKKQKAYKKTVYNLFKRNSDSLHIFLVSANNR